MSTSREQFLGRIEAIETILADPISIDTTPVSTSNSAAVAIRNGCTVMLFCALEGFIRGRSLECARAIDQAVVPYSHLPNGLKVASLVSTFEGLMNLSRGLSVADKIIEFEKAAMATAAGALGSSYQFTDYSFGRDKSNVTAEDLPKISKAFGVENFWSTARLVANKAGSAVAGNMDELFKRLSRERHRAAHVSNHNVPYSFLASAIPDAILVSLAFDLLISRGTDTLSKSAVSSGGVPAGVTEANVKFLIIKQRGPSNWAGFTSASSRALFVERSESFAKTRAIAFARSRSLDILELNPSGRPSSWRSVIG